MQIYGVLLPLPFNEVFDYKSEEPLKIGDLVKVSFGKEEQVGVVWHIGKTCKLPDEKIKHITEHMDFPPLNEKMISFIKFVSVYNMAFLGMVLKMVISVKQAFDKESTAKMYFLTGKTLSEAKLKNSYARTRVIDLLQNSSFTKQEIIKGVSVSPSVIETLEKSGVIGVKTIKKEIDVSSQILNPTSVMLNSEQKDAALKLCSKIGQGFSVTLLDGVTGSGKTETYFEAIEKTLTNGKQVLVLVPEITLTAQWLDRFKKRFGMHPFVWHSGLSQRKRTDSWIGICKNKARVIVGARSALFLPYQNLGLIVIDESHDHSFKQEDVVNYQGRDMAVVRAKYEDIPVILSTATPSLETLNNVDGGKYDRVVLSKRYSKAVLPQIKIIDLKKDKPQKYEGNPSWLSPTLIKALTENLEKGEQSALFLNRRGYAPMLICRECGTKIECPNCSSWLTEHKKGHVLMCHHCGYSVSTPQTCPSCGADSLYACGPGVERIAQEIKHRFPKAKTAVLSSDITTNLSEISEVISQMQEGSIDILIGTQILAKGHNFPGLTLVGIIDADLGLNSSDLRAGEKTFQLLSQVSGRAGRSDKKGMVYVQTLYPQNPILKALVDNNREQFLQMERHSRKILHYPPFANLASIIISSANADYAASVAHNLVMCAPKENCEILGPAQAPIFLLRGKYRYRLLVKTPKHVKIQQLLKEWLQKIKSNNKVNIEIDIDPYSFM